jgi:hypothetical protein
MTVRTLRLGAAFAALLTLTACVGIKPVPPGPYASGGHQITVGRTWTDLGVIYGSPKAVRMLTIDGPMLNSLFVIDGLAPGEYLIKGASKEKPTPTFRTGMTPVEQVEFLADSLVALGFQRVETDGLRPVKVGDRDGLRVDITAKTAAGLDIGGLAQLAEVNGRLYIILYTAPAEHYFGATRAEVEAVMDSARIQG